MLENVDLNLLVALDALLTEQHVTRAARRLGMSQPAMSNALARLRRTLGDPLLVRTAHGMAPTRRALELEDPIRRALQRLEAALRPALAFDPAQAETTFVIGCDTYVQHVVIPDLVTRVAEAAPKVTLQISPIPAGSARNELEAGRLGMIIGRTPRFLDAVDDLHIERLYGERPTCVVRAGHAIMEGELTLERFARLRHVLVQPRGRQRGLIDRLLEAAGHKRIVGLATRDHIAALRAVASTDMIVTAPLRLVQLFTKMLALALLPPPLAIKPATVSLVWHPRTETDPGHRWLRDLARASGVAIEGRDSGPKEPPPGFEKPTHPPDESAQDPPTQ